jgi:hypothetical protein
VLLVSGRAFLPIGRGRRRRKLLRDVEGSGCGSSGRQPLNSLLGFFQQAEIIEHLLERWEGHHVHEDGAEVFEVLVQPAQDVQHENVVGDIDAEVDEGVGDALHLLEVVVDANPE